MARNFVRGCLNKIPKLRPTYSMLLKHGWLASLAKPTTISEEDEELSEDMENLAIDGGTIPEHMGKENSYDKEVADWVKAALERKKSGKMGEAAKPALHAAPLDTISPAASPAALAEGA
jgi:mitogen-activated protein kinase kinase